MSLWQTLKIKKILFAGIILIISLCISSITKADSDKPDVIMREMGKLYFKLFLKQLQII